MYRAVQHGACANRCLDGVIKRKFPREVQDFCGIFVQLQEKRHLADYDPFARFVLSDVRQDIASAESAIQSIRKLSAPDAKAFAIWLLLQKRD